jgi:hypothetical protein
MRGIVAQQVTSKWRKKALKEPLFGANWPTYPSIGSQIRLRRNNFPHYEI